MHRTLDSNGLEMGRREALGLLASSAAGVALDARGVLASALQPVPDVDLRLRAAPDEVRIFEGAPTRVWRYVTSLDRGPATTLQPLTGTHLGSVLRFRRGQRIRVRFRNDLDEPSIVHWHGLDVPEAADGHPRLAVGPGREYAYDFEVVNRAGTYWYHPHPHMRTAAQAYHGLAGVVIVSDPEDEALRLPSGDRELILVLQDRRIDASNQLVYPAAMDGAAMSGASRPATPGRGVGGMGMRGVAGGMGAMMETVNGWLGDRLLVTGRPHPATRVQRGAYRVRLLNGSNARIYRLALDGGVPLTVIGADGGLLEHARTQTTITLAPGQRVDTLIDFSGQTAGARVVLRSLTFPVEAVGRVGMMGETSPLPQGAPLDVMTFEIAGGAAQPTVRLPDRLCAPPAAWQPATTAPVRRVPLTFMRMQWLIAGRTFAMDEVADDETVAAGATQVWEFHNQPNPMGMAMAHPMHVHGTQFRVLSRSGADAHPLRAGIVDTPATDTVLVLPGETVRIQLTFSRYPGLYLYHCHILEHEDMGMMRNFRITAAR